MFTRTFAPAAVRRDKLDNPALHQSAKELPAAPGERSARFRWLVTAADQFLHRAAAIAGAAKHIQQHPVTHLEVAGQPLGRGGDQTRHGGLVPIHIILLRRLSPHELLPAARLLLLQLQVLDGMRRRLHHDRAQIVEAFASGATGDLVKIARSKG